MASPVASTSSLPAFDPAQLDAANALLSEASPQEILRWAVAHLPGLYQTTAFGLTGLASLDMISKISKKAAADKARAAHLVPVIFLDTLYHFEETLALRARLEKKYKIQCQVFTPPGVATTEEFEEMYGKELWKTDEDTYDYLVKVEPARRAYEELNVLAVITGRRRSQGADRATLQPLEIDSTGLIKVNPLCTWSFEQVKDYIDMAGVPYNALLDQGYKSIGDWHSTLPAAAGEGERGGRWAGAGKTECGLHLDYFKMKKAAEKKLLEKERKDRDDARGEGLVEESSVSAELAGLAL